MLETYRITAQLVADLAWPLVVSLLASAVLLRYPEEIRNLFVRLLGFKTPVASASFGPPAQEAPPAKTEPAAAAATPSQGDQAADLRFQLDQTWKMWSHEVTLRTIYGTQIELVRYLNNVVGATVSELDGFYQRHLMIARAERPNYVYPRESYLGYLILRGLVTQTGDRYSITSDGQDFLLYLTRMRIPEFKAY